MLLHKRWSWIISVVTLIGIVLPSAAQLPMNLDNTNLNNGDMDNIYHEDDHLSDDADIFPRMGKVTGIEQEQTNCRAIPWGNIVSHVSGQSFLEIVRRQVDSNGESWFYSSDLACWIHDSRIDLL